MSISVKILQISRFWSKFTKNFDFGQYLWKSRFWSKFMKISISVKIIEHFEFGQYSWKSRFWSELMKISVLVKIVGKSWSWSTFSENLDFSQYHLPIWGKIFPKSWFWSKFPKNVDLGQNLQICRFCSKNLHLGQNFWKYRFWWKLSKNLKFRQICRKISILDKIVENSRF